MSGIKSSPLSKAAFQVFPKCTTHTPEYQMISAMNQPAKRRPEIPSSSGRLGALFTSL